MNENAEILEYIYKNAKMGTDSLTTLLNAIHNKDNKMKPIIEDQLKEYEKFVKESQKVLKKYKVDLKEYNPMAKMSSWMGINMEMLKDNSDARVASMLIQGLTMGTIEMSKKIEDYEKKVEKDVLNLAKDFLKFQENSIEKTKPFL